MSDLFQIYSALKQADDQLAAVHKYIASKSMPYSIADEFSYMDGKSNREKALADLQGMLGAEAVNKASAE